MRLIFRTAMAVASSAALFFAAPAWADGIVDNVNGITLDREGKIVRFTALLIDEAGKVTKLVKPGQKAPKRPDWRSDGRGMTMIPGLIDAQGDIMELGFQLLTLDLSGARSLAEAQAAITAYAAQHPNRRWILGRGWDQSLWASDSLPTAGDLDRIVADKPVWLIHADGAAGWANSAAMQAAGVNAKSKIGASGRIGKVAGRPSGIFAGAAMKLIEAAVPPPRAKDRDLAFNKAQALLLSRGITASTDMSTDIHDWQAYRRAGDTRRLNMRIFGYAGNTQAMELIAGSGPTPWLYGDRLRLGGIAIHIDGGLASRGAWLKAPYADAPDMRGLRHDSYAELRNAMVRASMDEFQVSLRASGDAAVAEAISAVTDLAETFPGDRRWRIENVGVIDPADQSKLSAQGIVAVVKPVQAVQQRAMIEKRLGALRSAVSFPARSLAQGGILAFGAGIQGELNPFADMAAAITREDAQGRPFG